MNTTKLTGFNPLQSHDEDDFLKPEKQDQKSRWEDIRQRLATASRESRYKMDAEFRAVQWKRQLLFAPFFLWLSFLITVTVVLIERGKTGMGLSSMPSACMEDGSVNPGRGQQNFWSSGFFDITLKTNSYTYSNSGAMSFATVKIIDITWDVIIGRGGQGLMAIISWKVFRHYVSASMQSSPVTYQTFRLVFIDSDANVTTPFRLSQDFIKRRRLISTTAMVFMVLSTVYVLVFPTLAGSMTGYISVMKAFVKDRSGSIIPFDDFNYAAYIIHDAQRINLTADYIVPYVDTASSNTKQEPMATSPSPDCPNTGSVCSIKNATSIYVGRYGFHGLVNANTTWEIGRGTSKVWHATLTPPALNISAFYLSETPTRDDPLENTLFGNEWVDPLTGRRPFNDSAQLTWTANNHLFSLEDIKANGACQPILNAYEWGISFIQALMNAILLVLWTIGLFSLWLAAQFKLPMQKGQEVAKGWRAVSYLADTMNKQYHDAGIDPSILREKLLKQEINKYLNGGGISFTPESSLEDRLGLGQGLVLWFKQDKWWCLVLAILLFGTGFSLRPVLYPVLATAYGMLMAMALVNSVAGRLLVILPFIIITLVGLLFGLLYVV